MGTTDDRGQDAPELVLEELLRPKVPMGFYVGAPYAAALGICEALRAEGLDAQLAWPHDVVVKLPGGAARIEVGARGGYDDEGMFCRVEARVAQGGSLGDALGGALAEGVRGRFSSWEEGVRANHGAAGPLAAFLSDYFDLVGLMGERVRVTYPNGRLIAEGRFSGMDVWGRASVTLEDGHELTVTPEQARIRPGKAQDL